MNAVMTPCRATMSQAGMTLVELMVAMVIGLTVIGAGLAMYTSSGFSARGSSALSQMSEDANLALSLMRNHIAMAGYSKLYKDAASGDMSTLYTGLPILGCRYGINSTTTGNSLFNVDTTKSSTITCNSPSTAASDTLIVLYEADTDNTAPNAKSEPTDCLGNGSVQVPASATKMAYWIAENRFFIDHNGSLACQGNGNRAPQPIVDNVSQMRIWYGVANAPSAGERDTVARRYIRADQVGDMNNAAWRDVVSVRLCMVIRSKDPVLDTSAPYIDCDGNTINTADRRVYRAFTTTVVLNNRIHQN
jgi:type IV pilus assembly protein PilW